MIVRNWMQTDPVVVPSDMLVSEANRILTEGNLHALPVVDDDHLRGLITRANLLRVGHYVSRAQNADELDYFVTRLRVRDIMVRNPATVQATDTMQHCMRKGRQLGVAQFPVLDGERVVGVISANEIFALAAHCLGALEQRSGLTLAPVRMGPGVLGHIADVAEGAGAVLQALYPITTARDGPEYGAGDKKVVIRFHAAAVGDVVSALEAAGFPVLESSDARQSLAA
ncbi:MAG TPA: CBS domain-containing protein [Burkholderiaceae bacterium]|nr:CBS domain-containing protein [Burkholderiaceae bacterium]